MLAYNTTNRLKNILRLLFCTFLPAMAFSVRNPLICNHLINVLDCQMLNFTRRVSFFKRPVWSKKSADTEEEKPPQADDSESVVEYAESPPVPYTKYYKPSGVVESRVLSLAQQYSTDKVIIDTELSDNLFKYKVLTACIEEFQFDVPNYELGEMKTISDVVQYYSLEQNPINPEEALKTADIPKNVHMEFEPNRFTEETKHLYGGKTAFPQRDTIVTSLKYRHVYKGYKNEPVYKKKDGFRYF